MSEDILSVIPTDPHWQPTQQAADRTVTLARQLSHEDPDGLAPGNAPAPDPDLQIDVDWYDAPTPVDAGDNLERITCPHCAAQIPVTWFLDLLETHCETGFPTLATVVPCCDTATTLDALHYDWPCGFARFEIAVWNPEHVWFTDEQLTALGAVLGHPVRQIRAHI
ncbi:hypothetical protein [Streptomyces sp. NPDC002588]|uniref:hypothetical protein n=1 Tax=Streptomyces sp. NPDC002588 TaxID=3154419 RepID=UPI00331E4056